MKKLSRPQFDALRYAKGRDLYAESVNSGDGNMRRSILSLIKHGLLGWDPTAFYRGRLVLTELGKQKLAEALEERRAKLRGTVDDPRKATAIAKELSARGKL
ncbi:MAG TPA: hypothetical protein VLE97_02035 [Gaiellaceae bacterium]|nr:hypothetical protein [Gaiellaceae bacterium]